MSRDQIGVPIRILHEGEGHTISVELRNGEIYRGTLKEAEDTMNCFLENVTMTARDGRVSKLEQVYIRGSQVKLIILPEVLKHSPAFNKVQTMKKKNDEKEAAKRPFKGRKSKSG
uniref:Small nuclear ribonucleoprotein Sm D3 n=1 Tax=Rhizochromulina marina TaxID=1034831 RepID=A0A7S2S181_9STRA|mmetsp:Transcript_23241/g.67817  ORF Transcript_23241/g.67817 Transcript_23241/m.67817 type:complete len:115 (+) Transcript_23241:204-548(+)|eukprot:CAMPEP_0118973282 /NCGR_PEP_ID=MMETSP1173-20130426/9710_1 /TAXON_ID=1034831 /ORGANISM="Rhizochromulina marina cf, Strain CCMP1243" /LENGTH=114 /DNA_ID=CAMNT_0006922907 /DNA_START=198 /DNA_END=542 /DNA_ORIENTATION=+